jgi:hypothetical protein
MFSNPDITCPNGRGVEAAVRQIALYRVTERERAATIGTPAEKFWDSELEEHRNRILLWLSESHHLPKSVAWVLDLFSLVLKAEGAIIFCGR